MSGLGASLSCCGAGVTDAEKGGERGRGNRHTEIQISPYFLNHFIIHFHHIVSSRIKFCNVVFLLLEAPSQRVILGWGSDCCLFSSSSTQFYKRSQVAFGCGSRTQGKGGRGKRNVVSLLTCIIMICFCKHVPFLLLFSGMAISPSSSPFLSTPSSALPHRFSSYELGGMRTGVPGSREMFRLPDIGRTACH